VLYYGIIILGYFEEGSTVEKRSSKPINADGSYFLQTGIAV
jgi:hypothetical protein